MTDIITFSSQMRCKFLVGVQWEKYRDLVSHKCFDLEEEIVSCKDESNFEVDFGRQSVVKACFF